MYGLEAISANNGWAMAITGPLIVMSGLTILALIISQLHRVTGIFDKKTMPKPEAAAEEVISAPEHFPSDIFETAEIYQPLIDKLEQPFELQDLYRIAGQHDFPHPIMTVSRFRGAGILKNEGNGLFTWNR